MTPHSFNAQQYWRSNNSFSLNSSIEREVSVLTECLKNPGSFFFMLEKAFLKRLLFAPRAALWGSCRLPNLHNKKNNSVARDRICNSCGVFGFLSDLMYRCAVPSCWCPQWIFGTRSTGRVPIAPLDKTRSRTDAIHRCEQMCHNWSETHLCNDDWQMSCWLSGMLIHIHYRRMCVVTCIIVTFCCYLEVLANKYLLSPRTVLAKDRSVIIAWFRKTHFRHQQVLLCGRERTANLVTNLSAHASWLKVRKRFQLGSWAPRSRGGLCYWGCFESNNLWEL